MRAEVDKELQEKCGYQPQPDGTLKAPPMDQPDGGANPPAAKSPQEETPEQHAAKRAARRQAAFEKRLEKWEQDIVGLAPEGSPDRGRLRELAAALRREYRKEYEENGAECGKPPRVVIGAVQGVQWNADGTEIVVGAGFPPSSVTGVSQDFAQRRREYRERRKRIYENARDKAAKIGADMLHGNHTAAQDAAATNPNYWTGEYRWTHNCQRCVTAYEARRRGIDAEAQPGPSTPQDLNRDPLARAQCGWADAYVHQPSDIIDCHSNSGPNAQAKVEREVTNMPVGARCVVHCAWQGGGAHVFIAERTDKGVVFREPQTNGQACVTSDGTWGQSASGSWVYIMRIDDKEFTDAMTQCAQPVPKPPAQQQAQQQGGQTP
jgi:hypothetical protein